MQYLRPSGNTRFKKAQGPVGGNKILWLLGHLGAPGFEAADANWLASVTDHGCSKVLGCEDKYPDWLDTSVDEQ